MLNEYAINLAIEILKLTKSKEILIGFNSLNAFASVNHLHLHLYYLDHNQVIKQRIKNEVTYLRSLPIQNVKFANRIATNLWSLADNYYFPGFAIQLSDFNNESEFSSKLFMITNYLCINEIPHNCVLVKASSLVTFESDQNLSNHLDTFRAVVWPRKSCYGSN